MTGTEKILQHIRDGAAAEAESIRQAAEAECARIREDSAAVCEEILLSARSRSDELAGSISDKTRLSLTMERRQALLAAKGELVDEVLAKARQKLLNEDPAAYFRYLLSLLEKQETIGEGTLSLSAGDLARLPAAFAEKAKAIAAAKGGSLTIDEKPAAISGGFILSYRDTLENCSLDAIFAAEEETLKDMIRQSLFSNLKA